MSSQPIKHLHLSVTLLAASFFISSIAVFAASSLSRDQVLKASLETASVLVAQARVNAAEAQALIANIPISGSASLGYGWTGVDPKPATGDAIKGDWTYGAQINFAGVFGEASTSRVQAGVNLERSRLGLLGAVLKANKSAITLWHGLRKAEASLETANGARALAELQDKAAESRLQSGAINQGERETTRIALQSAQLEGARAQNRLEAAQSQLEILFGLTGVTAGSWQALPVPPAAANLERREDLFEARAALAGAQLDLARAQRAVLPTLNLDAGLQGAAGGLGLKLNSDLAAGVSYNSPSSNTTGLPSGLSSGLSSGGTSWNLGLSLNIPLDPAKIVAWPALEKAVQAAQVSLEASIKATKADASSKRSALLLSQKGLKLGEQQLELAKQNLDRGQQRFAAGLVAALEVKRAELEVLKARDGLLTAQADLDSSVLDVFEAINQPVVQPDK